MGLKYELKGDVNGDGKITHLDAVLILNYLAEKIDLTTSQKYSADVDSNGQIQATDARQILNHLTGKNLITDIKISSN
jgi:hypothetical protein